MAASINENRKPCVRSPDKHHNEILWFGLQKTFRCTRNPPVISTGADEDLVYTCFMLHTSCNRKCMFLFLNTDKTGHNGLVLSTVTVIKTQRRLHVLYLHA
ncbi:hypothetical protein AMECASPLE_012570 [Ameca splendens]|uniref:Uncharacterized protein n=1 Tax=Ameca splendens TaxID=208324 RepID=A0ABV0YPC6_9TELE